HAHGHVAGLWIAGQAAAPAGVVGQDDLATVGIVERRRVLRRQVVVAAVAGPRDGGEVRRIARLAGRRFVAARIVLDLGAGHVAGDGPAFAAQATVDAPRIQRVGDGFDVVADVALEVRAGARGGHAVDDGGVGQHAVRIVRAGAAADRAFQ